MPFGWLRRWFAGDRPRRKPAVLRLPFTIHILAWLGLGVAVAAGSMWAVWVFLGSPSLATDSTKVLTADDKFNGLKIALTVVGGLGGVIALTVAYRKQRLGEAAERREDTKLFNERFTKASELIGSDQAAVRLAGVYAMAALADDWPAGQQTCIDVLCAYLRMPYDSPGSTAPPRPNSRQRGHGLRKPSPLSAPTPARSRSDDPREERQVRHTVIRVIADHLRPSSPNSWQGRSFDFTEAVFDGGSFSGVEFANGIVDFSRSKFTGGEVGFFGAEFTGGRVDFSDAEVAGGIVGFFLAKFAGGDVDFNDAVFSGGIVDFSYASFTGGDVDFSYAEFTGCTVHFQNARFSGGIVDLGRPDVYATPPQFDEWPDGVPVGLLLPELEVESSREPTTDSTE